MLNKQIFETLYYGALEASCELAERDGPYQTYEGSPVSKGILQVTRIHIQLSYRHVRFSNSRNLSGCQMVLIWNIRSNSGPKTSILRQNIWFSSRSRSHVTWPFENWTKSVQKVECSKFGSLMYRWLLYSGDVNTDHLDTGNI